MQYRVETLRSMTKLEQEDFANKIGMSRQTYINKIKGKTGFSWNEMLTLKEFVEKKTKTKISLDDIIVD